MSEQPKLLTGPEIIKPRACSWCRGVGLVTVLNVGQRQCPTCRGTGIDYDTLNNTPDIDGRARLMGLGQ